MTKKLGAVFEALINEGEDKALLIMKEYIRESAVAINNKLIKEDDDLEPESEEASGNVVILTVAYPDPEGSCSYDQAILTALDREDMDGAGWADGIRTLVFQYDSMEDADNAAETLENRDEDSDLPEEISTDASEIDFDTEEDEDKELEEDDSGQSSPLSDTRPECKIEEAEGSEDSNKDSKETPVDVETTEVEVEPDFSDIFTDPNESIDDKINDLASEIEDLKAQIAAALDSDNSLEEAFDYEKVAPVKNEDGVDAVGEKITSGNDTSLIDGKEDTSLETDASPIKIDNEHHVGFDREKAPEVKEIKLGRNVRDCFKDGMEVVPPEGDKSALVNKSDKQNNKSVIA